MDRDILFVVVLGLIAAGFFGGLVCGTATRADYKEAYIDALIDMNKGRQPKYILVEKPNGEKHWEDNLKKENKR